MRRLVRVRAHARTWNRKNKPTTSTMHYMAYVIYDLADAWVWILNGGMKYSSLNDMQEPNSASRVNHSNNNNFTLSGKFDTKGTNKSVWLKIGILLVSKCEPKITRNKKEGYFKWLRSLSAQNCSFNHSNWFWISSLRISAECAETGFNTVPKHQQNVHMREIVKKLRQ